MADHLTLMHEIQNQLDLYEIHKTTRNQHAYVTKDRWNHQEGIDHVLHIFNTLGITKTIWMEKTGLNADQYYRWHNPEGTATPNGYQTYTILHKLGISANYFFFSIGPMTLKECLDGEQSIDTFIDQVQALINQGGETLKENLNVIPLAMKNQVEIVKLLNKLNDKLEAPP